MKLYMHSLWVYISLSLSVCSNAQNASLISAGCVWEVCHYSSPFYLSYTFFFPSFFFFSSFFFLYTCQTRRRKKLVINFVKQNIGMNAAFVWGVFFGGEEWGWGRMGGILCFFFMRTSTSGVIMPAFVLGKRQSEIVCG